MSVITVQIGQCGNQIGDKLFATFLDDCLSYECSNLTGNKFSRQQVGTETNKSSLSLRNIKQINQLYTSESIERFFSINDANENSNVKGACSNDDTKLYARSVLVDMESKVVQKIIYDKDNKKKAALNWTFREQSSFTQKRGSGNNW
jgi:hypothetical protein